MIFNIVIYACCQGEGIHILLTQLLPKSKISLLVNYRMIRKKKKIPIDLLNQADVFIYQHLGNKHGIYSTDINHKDNVIKFLNNKCIKIIFPNLVNTGLWTFHKNTEPIEKLKDKGLNVTQIIDMYKNGEIDFEYKKRFLKSIKILELEEKNHCNVTISKYIKDNLQTKKLFFDDRHPTKYLYIVVVNQILKILKINKVIDENNYPLKLVNIKGYIKHTSYDKKYFNFYFQEKYYDNDYINTIKYIYNNYTNES